MEGALQAKNKRKATSRGFVTHIHAIIKDKYEKRRISSKAIYMLNSLITNACKRVALKSKIINTSLYDTKTKTFTLKWMKGACKLVLGRELYAEIDKFASIRADRYKKIQAKAKIPKGLGKSEYKAPEPIQKQVGLTISVSRVEKMVRFYSCFERVGKSAVVYLTAVLEYICIAILELVIYNIVDPKDHTKMITEKYILSAIRGGRENDEALSNFYKGSVLSGGVVPYINEALLQSKTKKSKKE